MTKKIYEGNSQKGGEVGHMTVVPEGGEQCYCGRKGCFDTVCRSTLLDQYTDGTWNGSLDFWMPEMQRQLDCGINIWTICRWESTIFGCCLTLILFWADM